MTERKRSILIGCVLAFLFLWAGIEIGVAAAGQYLVIPRDQVPGYTFTMDSVTYQVRPIKITRTLYWDGQADSCYRRMLEIRDRSK